MTDKRVYDVSKEYLLAEKYFFNTYQICKLTSLTKNQIQYITNALKIILPIYSSKGQGRYFNFRQVSEFKLLAKLHLDYKLKMCDLKKAKDTLKSIDETTDLTDKSVLFAYGDLFFIDRNDTESKLISLINKNKEQKTLISLIVLSDLEKEVDDTAKNIFNFAEYKAKKEYKNYFKLA